MDFRDTPEEAEYRAEVVDWLESTLPDLPGAPEGDHEARVENARWWQEKMYEGGWAGITWPEEYGGRGLTIVHEAIFNEESAKRDAPTPINLLGNILAGPTILVHGTDEQKERFLPKILSGEEVWCQGFSEPAAGSDLAGLQSRATEAEGGWVVSGQKVWTSYAHAADRCMLLARTSSRDESGSKHVGITYFLASMEDIEVRPLVMINGAADFNEMFMSDVFVSEDEVLGDVGDGWKVALTTLAFERGSLAFTLTATARRAYRSLLEHATASGAMDDPVIRDRLAGFYAEVEALRIGTVRQMSAVSAGKAPGAEGSALKFAWARTMQAITRTAVQLSGTDGVALDSETSRRWANGYLRARGNSVEGGTDEIQLSIIAERVLGLPRSR
ncbi:MAG: acyl-CoA dehydrogenase family protein [Actinobacteria bacterium]|nr:acyl-CoA dehydrogenase family protein [Actinomycetota bacterium]